MPDVAGAVGGHGVYIWPQGFTVNDDCYAYYYYYREDGSSPLAGKVDSGCD
jgi:hypothetical protein